MIFQNYLENGAPGGKDAVDLAVIVKLTRVVLLLPVAVLVGIWANRARFLGLFSASY